MAQFFLCHNPLAELAENRAGYLYHYSKPRFFTHILSIDPAKPFKDMHYGNPNLMFACIRGDGRDQLYVLIVDYNTPYFSDR